MRDELDRVGKPRESVDVSERTPPPRELKSHGTKSKFMKARRGLRGKNIYTDKDFTKDNHDFLLQIKKDCAKGIAVYPADGCVTMCFRQMRELKKGFSHREE